jgi:hypothetical protein
LAARCRSRTTFRIVRDRRRVVDEVLVVVVDVTTAIVVGGVARRP